MTVEFCDLLSLFECAAHGKKEINKINSDIKKVLTLAERQGVLTVIFPAIKRLYQNSETNLTKQEFENYNLRFTSSVSMNLQRKYAVSNVVRMLENEGINCCMLKGDILADLYAVSETRISSDTDILLDSLDLEEKVCEIMQKHGFDVLERPHTSHHAMCRSKATGLIEFHLSLYDELFEDVWFNRLHETFEPQRKYVTKMGIQYTTLGITDGAVFVSLHFIKHFLTQGAGLRQLMDMLLYLNKNKDEIKWEKFNSVMTELKYDKFLKTCAKIGEKYLGFEKDPFSKLEGMQKETHNDVELSDCVLTDIEEGGVFGYDDAKRKDFYKLYTELRYSRFKDGDFVDYMKEWGHVSLLRRLFPTKKSMEKQYEILKKHPTLLPFMYVRRIANRVMGVKRGERLLISYKNIEGDRERLEMIKKLDMI